MSSNQNLIKDYFEAIDVEEYGKAKELQSGALEQLQSTFPKVDLGCEKMKSAKLEATVATLIAKVEELEKLIESDTEAGNETTVTP
jgi:hypothetical protein